jgi:phosphate acetyltransferase
VSFAERLLERAREAVSTRSPRVVLAEGHDPRIRDAGARLNDLGISTVTVLDRDTPRPSSPTLARHLCTRRPDRFPDEASALDALSDPLLVGACLVGTGGADVMVGGADRPTGDVIRAALWAVGLAPGVVTASSAFYMVQGERVVTFTDCAVVPEPSPAQLIDIALWAARDRRYIVGDEPVVAFLSYSTKGSARGRRVTRIVEAVERLRGLADFVFDGELQGDAALAPEVARTKAPGSPVAGRANVLVFPDLDSGNIAYKLVQRLGGWMALGPVLQGFAKPVADLSRGATVDDIVLTTAIAVLQSEGSH